MTIANRPESTLILPSNILEGPYRVDQVTWEVCYNDTHIVHDPTDSRLPGAWSVISSRQAHDLSLGRPVVVHHSQFDVMRDVYNFRLACKANVLALDMVPGGDAFYPSLVSLI